MQQTDAPRRAMVRRRSAATFAGAIVTAALAAVSAAAAPGALDPAFGSGGKVLTDLGGVSAASAVAVQTDGKIVVAGFSGDGTAPDFALARYNKNGTPDTSFGSGGSVSTDFGAYDKAFAVAIQKDGKIVAAGSTGPFSGGGAYQFALVRYTKNGGLDPSFGSGGKVVTPLGGQAYGVAIQKNGRILAAGYSSAGAFQNFAVARYRKNGTLDPSFGTGGSVSADFGVGSRSQAAGIALQKDGRIVTAGDTIPQGVTFNFAVARFTKNGKLDPGFGNGGRVVTAFSGGGIGRAVTLQKNGMIVVAGNSGFGTGTVPITLARYQTNGSLDPGFGSGGRSLVPFSAAAVAFGVVVQKDGRIDPAGEVSFTGFAVARCNKNGSVDTSFGSGGTVITQFGGDAEAQGMALQGTRLVVAGFLGDNGGKVALARYLLK